MKELNAIKVRLVNVGVSILIGYLINKLPIEPTDNESMYIDLT